jgi:hypothetical protein
MYHKEIEMDLAKVPVRTIATLIANGTRQIGEVPTARRSMVQNEVDKILAAKAEVEKEKKRAAKKGKKQKDDK